MATEQIPQDILDDANKLYPVETLLFVNHPHPYDIHKNERDAYIRGRLDERANNNSTSHITQPQDTLVHT